MAPYVCGLCIAPAKRTDKILPPQHSEVCHALGALVSTSHSHPASLRMYRTSLLPYLATFLLLYLPTPIPSLVRLYF